jgi:hypothetical protein
MDTTEHSSHSPKRLDFEKKKEPTADRERNQSTVPQYAAARFPTLAERRGTIGLTVRSVAATIRVHLAVRPSHQGHKLLQERGHEPL